MSNEATLGIHRVSSEDLKRLLRALHRGALPSPITRSALIEKAFGHIEGHLDSLVGRDLACAKVAVAAVLAERDAKRSHTVQLAYTGLPLPGTRSRDMLEQVRDLLGGAEKSLELYGLTLGDDRRLMRTIASIIEGRQASARLVFDAHGSHDPTEAVRAFVREHFLGKAQPEVFVAVQTRLRARIVIVDGARVLVTSGELTGQEEDGVLDLGARIDDPSYVVAWHAEWNRLLAAGAFVRV